MNKIVVIQNDYNEEVVCSIHRIVLVRESSIQDKSQIQYTVYCDFSDKKMSMKISKKEYERVKNLMLEESEKEELGARKIKSSIAELGIP